MNSKTAKTRTMEAVARRASVSITTVSHVINKTRHVQTETREAVLRAIKELGYHPSRNNKTSRAVNIGVIVADARQDYFSGMVKTVESSAAEYGALTIFCDSELTLQKEEKNLALLLERNIQGILLAPVMGGPMPAILEKTSIPVILIDQQYDGHHFLFVGIDNFRSSYQGTRNLLEKGTTRIGFIGYSDSMYTMKQRFLGYRAAVLETGLALPPCYVSINYYENDSFPVIQRFILDYDLDGVLCANSSLCYETIDVVDSLEKHIRRRLKIVCFDDNRWLDFVKYPISVISQPVVEIGSSAVENLMRCIKTNVRHTVKQELLFDVTFIDRSK